MIEHYKRKGFFAWINRIFWIRDQRGVIIPPAIFIIMGVIFFSLLARYDMPKKNFHPVMIATVQDQNCEAKIGLNK